MPFFRCTSGDALLRCAVDRGAGRFLHVFHAHAARRGLPSSGRSRRGALPSDGGGRPGGDRMIGRQRSRRRSHRFGGGRLKKNRGAARARGVRAKPSRTFGRLFSKRFVLLVFSFFVCFGFDTIFGIELYDIATGFRLPLAFIGKRMQVWRFLIGRF